LRLPLTVAFLPIIMAPINIPLVAAIAIVMFGVYKWIVYPAFFSPLAKIPNARWHASFCPLWSYYVKYANIENNTVYELHKRLGPIVRMGPRELSVNCYEGGLKTIYTGGFPKTDFYANRFTNYG
jgi:unspecific monooxygenase